MKPRGEVDYEAKAVKLAGRRYIVCRNLDQMKKDAADRAAIVAALEKQLSPLEAMLVYTQLWTVERTFRTTKSLFETRPIYHKLDETIRGHVACSFLALVLKKELETRLAASTNDGRAS
jgi:transposase